MLRSRGNNREKKDLSKNNSSKKNESGRDDNIINNNNKKNHVDAGDDDDDDDDKALITTTTFRRRNIKHLPTAFYLALVFFLLILLINFNIYHKLKRIISPSSSSTTTTPAPQNKCPSSPFQKTEAQLSPAYEESLSFFDDISSSSWSLMKKKVKDMDDREVADSSDDIDAGWYYQNHAHVNFLCQDERRIGRPGDGGKWVCDPHRIAHQPSCLVYSVGSEGDFSFEKAILSLLPHCEIHTFDPGDYAADGADVGTNYHKWGISNVRRGVYKTLQQTVTELGHVGRTVDIFKIDCEGCEFDTFRGWFFGDDDGEEEEEETRRRGVMLRQILVEVHHDKYWMDRYKTKEFYSFLRERGYVIFHREANIQYSFFGENPRCLEIGFLKLNSTFFD